jgi:hypothetical protein
MDQAARGVGRGEGHVHAGDAGHAAQDGGRGLGQVVEAAVGRPIRVDGCGQRPLPPVEHDATREPGPLAGVALGQVRRARAAAVAAAEQDKEQEDAARQGEDGERRPVGLAV